MSTRELVEIMTGVTPPKEWRHDNRNIYNKSHTRVLALFEVAKNAEFSTRAAQNFEPLVKALQAVLANDREGVFLDHDVAAAACAALNNALKP